jgi:integrase
MITVTLVFDWRKRVKGNDEGPVDVRITHERITKYIGTGVRVRKSEFLDGMVVRRQDADELNKILQDYRKRVLKVAGELLDKDMGIEVGYIKRAVLNSMKSEGESDSAFYDWLCNQVPMLDVGVGTRLHYDTLLTRIREYGKMNAWGDVTAENIVMFDSWLHNIKKPQSDAERKAKKPVKCISDGAVYNYHKCLKALLRRAVRFDKIEQNPYDKLRGEFKRGDEERLEFLTDEEMKDIEALHPVKGSQMAITRDLYVFQMHTGLSYADTQAFDIRNYKKVKGRWTTVGQRVKTGEQYVIQLSEECERILATYGMKLPKIGNAKYNKHLKTLGEVAGIEKPLKTHLARHSFATKMIASGAAIQNVKAMLGHKNIQMTMRYAKVQPESVFAEFRRVEKNG